MINFIILYLLCYFNNLIFIQINIIKLNIQLLNWLILSKYFILSFYYQDQKIKGEAPYTFTGQLLGRGSYGSVYLAQDKIDQNKKYAVKIIPNQKINKTILRNEIAILQACYHSDNQNTYIVTEYAAGGELFQSIIRRKYYDEEDARAIVKQILSAIFYLSANNVLHGDLKPENCLLQNLPSNYEYSQVHYIPIVKLADFGTARIFKQDSFSYQTFGGTPGYVAPEVIMHKEFTTEPDIYSLGVLTYVLISGTHPFSSNNVKNVLRLQIENKWGFNNRFQNISPACIDFISKCMTYDYTKRPTARQLLKHRWMQEVNLRPFDLSNNKEELKKLIIKIRARSGFQSVIIANVLKDLVEEVKQKINQQEMCE